MTNTLSTSIATGITLASGGNYQSPFTITSTGIVAPTAYGATGVYGSAASGLTLINQGIIHGGNQPGQTGGDAVDLIGASAFDNSGTITGGSGEGIGINLTGTGSFTNSGIINAGYLGRAGQGGAAVALAGAGVFTNTGQINASTGDANYGGAGVNLSGGATFINSAAAFVQGNYGVVKGGAGVDVNGGVLINAGRILGGRGYEFKSYIAPSVTFGGSAGTLVVESGAYFHGAVNANSADELAIGGTSPVTLDNVSYQNDAGQYNGFGTLAFEYGATGTLFGYLGQSTIVGFGRSDALYVQNFTASGSIATIGTGGTLTLANVYGQTRTLTFASADVGDVVNLYTGHGPTGIRIDRNVLNRSTPNGITLTATGTYQSPFTITSAGAVTPGTSGGNGASGVYGAVSGQILHNYGYVRGWGGSNGFYAPLSIPGLVDTNGSLGGAGVDLVGGSIINAGTIVGGGGGGAYGRSAQQGGLGGAGGAGVILSGAATLTNSGTIFGGAGGPNLRNYTVYGGVGGAGISVNGGVIVDSGLIAGGFSASGTRADAVQFGTNASTLIVEHGATFTGNVLANSAVSDVLAIGGSAPVYLSGIGAKYQNFRSLAFETGSSGTASGTYTAMDSQSLTNIAGFAQGDTLILNGFAATSDTYVSGTGLELGNGTSEITLDISGNFSTANFNVIDPPANTTISLNPPCFAQGTRILTTRGEIPVEQLRANDHAILHTGGTAPIQWIGHRSLAPSRHPNPKQINPIRITAGALQNNIPHRDLVLSPDHALYLNGALIPAKSLLNGTTIRQESRRTVTYYHIELAHHAVLYAEGTPAESYLETGNRHAFSNGGSALTLHPDFAQTLREQTSCAPFAESGPIVEKTRAQILARTNQHLTNNPGLTLHTNQDGSIIIASRSAIPGQLNPDPRDQRILGVKILSLHAGAQKIPLDHPDLTEGWHTVEADGRWTNGRAMIPAALAKGGPITLELAATTQYPTQHPKRQSA